MSEVINWKTALADSLEKLHHAYCLEGDREVIVKNLLKFLEEDLKFSTKGNSDFYYASFETLGIDEGRTINEMQLRKAVTSPRRIFIIAANFITREAQNSLLKMFEEPSSDAIFFLITPSASILLPTLRSRFIVLNFSRIADHKESNILTKDYFFDAKKFIEAAVPERLNIVKDLSEKIVKEEISKSVAVDFLNNLEKELVDRIDVGRATSKDMFIFNEIEKCRNYAGNRSPSIKMLLEHIALIV